MGQDIRARHAAEIAASKVFETSDNISCGKYRMLLKRVIDGMITTRDGDRPGVIFEMTPVTSEPLPQTEGDLVLDGKTVPPGTAGAKLKDDGLHPNAVGSNVGLKIFFDGPGARSAPGNVRQVVLGIHNRHEGEISNDDVARTWLDITLMKDLKKGEAYPGTDPVIHAIEDRIANPICGILVDCVCTARKKSKANDKGAYISKPTWSNRCVPGQGDNAPELVAKRRAEIEAQIGDDEEVAPPPAGSPTVPQSSQPQPQNGAQTPSAPVPPQAAPSPPAQAQAWAPPPPWHKPAGNPQYAPNPDPAKDWYWDGGAGVKSAAQIRAGQ